MLEMLQRVECLKIATASTSDVDEREMISSSFSTESRTFQDTIEIRNVYLL
jgi:hypothetical protein